jgi:hypothetical protein
MTRVACCVPFCRRTTARQFVEWICREHWLLIDPRKRRVYARQRRRFRRFAGDEVAAEIFDRVTDRLWRNIKREAIERAVGVA